MKGDQPHDPRGLIFEAYRMELTAQECRSIFFDWALGFEGQARIEVIAALLARYGAAQPGHPMTAVLREGLGAQGTPPRRRGGRSARHTD